MHERKLVHVIGYQNRARSLSTGPNAMILPFPALHKMGPENCLETTNLKWMMKDFAHAVTPPPDRRVAMRSFGSEKFGSARSVTVFDSGEYTVVLADDARDVPLALERVPENKRPEINEEIFDAYAKWYKDWPIAVCCFETKREMEPEPLLWWYEPQFENLLFAPALDSHSGKAPDLNYPVRVDHTVVFGSTITPRGAPVRFRHDVPKHIRSFVADRVIGQEYTRELPNGDFVVPLDRLQKLDERLSSPKVEIDRLPPPGAKRSDGSKGLS